MELIAIRKNKQSDFYNVVKGLTKQFHKNFGHMYGVYGKLMSLTKEKQIWVVSSNCFCQEIFFKESLCDWCEDINFHSWLLQYKNICKICRKKRKY